MGNNVSRKPSDHRPSRSVTGIAREKSRRTICDFFSKKTESDLDQKLRATAWRH
jgi:hypothetical protein